MAFIYSGGLEKQEEDTSRRMSSELLELEKQHVRVVVVVSMCRHYHFSVWGRYSVTMRECFVVIVVRSKSQEMIKKLATCPQGSEGIIKSTAVTPTLWPGLLLLVFFLSVIILYYSFIFFLLLSTPLPSTT